MAAPNNPYAREEMKDGIFWISRRMIPAIALLVAVTYLAYPAALFCVAGISWRAIYGEYGISDYFRHTAWAMVAGLYDRHYPDFTVVIAEWIALMKAVIAGWHPVLGSTGIYAGWSVILFDVLLTLGTGLWCAACPFALFPTTYGNARFATYADVHAMGILTNKKNHRNPPMQGYLVILGRLEDGSYMAMPNTLTCMAVCPPGAGKTSGVCVPTILKCTHNPQTGAPISMLINDVKPELFKFTSGYRSKFSDCYQLSYGHEDNPEKNIYYTRYNFLNPDSVPPRGVKRDLYIENASIMLNPSKGSEQGDVWVKSARNLTTGMLFYIINKCEQATLQDMLLAAFRNYKTAATFPPDIVAEIDILMRRIIYRGRHLPAWETKTLTVEDLVHKPIGTWEGLPERFWGKPPSMGMLLAYLIEIQDRINQTFEAQLEAAKNPDEKIVAQQEQKEADRQFWRQIVQEIRTYNYEMKALQQIQAFSALHPEGRSSVRLNFDSALSIFATPAVANRTSDSDWSFAQMRGRWDPLTKTFRSMALYVSVTEEEAQALAIPTGLLIEALSKYLIVNKPNPVVPLRAYHLAKDELDTIAAAREINRFKLKNAYARGDRMTVAKLQAEAADIESRFKQQYDIVDKRKRKLRLDPQGEPIGPAEVLFVLDEFPRLPKLEALLIGPEVGRGQKIGFLLIGQDLGQIEERYGASGVNRFFTNSWAKIAQNLSNDQAADRLAGLSGQYTHKNRTKNFSAKPFEGGGGSESTTGMALLTKSDLLSMEQTFGEGMQITWINSRNNRPIVNNIPAFYADKTMMYLVHPDEIQDNKDRKGPLLGYYEVDPMPAFARATRKWKDGIRNRNSETFPAGYREEEFNTLGVPQKLQILEREAQQMLTASAA